MSRKIRYMFLSASAFTLIASAFAQEASAQVWNSYGYGLGTSLLYPLTYLPYQLLYGLRYGGSAYTPNNMMYQASYAPYGYLPYGGKLGLGNNNNQPYNNNSGQFNYGQPPVNAQGNPYNNNNFYAPNYNQPQWQNQPSPNQVNQQKPAAPATAFNDPFNSTYTPASQGNVVPTPQRGEESLPPAAPDRFGARAPLVDGFINAVNGKYGGDINRAMKEKDIYSWARALNLVDGGKPGHFKVSEGRAEAIGKILKDESLDPQSKLNTLKVLMK